MANVMASNTVPPFAVPSGQFPPFFVITPTDQAGTIVIVTAVCLITAIVSILVRAYVLTQLNTFRLHWEDWAILVALLLAMIQTSLVQKEAAAGLGTTIHDLTSHKGRQVQRLQFVDHILFILSVWTSKISTALFLYRLSPRAGDRAMSRGTMAFIGITGITGVLVSCFVCNIAQPWYYFDSEEVTCTSPYSRWVAVSVMDILSEVVLACLATKIMWPLQMRTSRKFTAGIIFYQRLAIIAPIIVRLHFLSSAYHGNDPTLQATYSTICKEVEIAFAIFATNIPCFRPFLLTTATHYGAPTKGTTSAFSHHAVSGQSTELTNLSSGKRSAAFARDNSTHASQKKTPDFSKWTGTQYTAATTSSRNQQHDANSTGSNDSKEMIIRKDVDYHVQYYDREAGPSIRDSF